MLLLRACPRCGGALWRDRYEPEPVYWCLNCGCVLLPDLQLPHVEPPGVTRDPPKPRRRPIPYS